MRSHRWERLENHEFLDGEIGSLPLLVIPGEGLTSDSQAFFQAANLLKANWPAYFDSFEVFRDWLERLVRDENQTGLTIEDSGGAGSVSIGPQRTEITRHRIGELGSVATPLLLEMVDGWDYLKPDNSRETK